MVVFFVWGKQKTSKLCVFLPKQKKLEGLKHMGIKHQPQKSEFGVYV